MGRPLNYSPFHGNLEFSCFSEDDVSWSDLEESSEDSALALFILGESKITVDEQ